MTSMSPDPLFDLSCCRLCPRECGVNRILGQTGFCGNTNRLRAARAALLYYEEPCISGTAGSGAVFFTGCSLGCVFCQNAEISGAAAVPDGTVSAAEISPQRLRDIFFELEAQGAANINLVTASHFLPLVIPALEEARGHGLSIPIVYNTSAYEKPEALRHLDGLVDIYLPDFKFFDSAISRRWAAAPDYRVIASAAIGEMLRQIPTPLFEDGACELNEREDGTVPLMKRGVIVRHLVMPGLIQDSKRILKFLCSTYGNRIFISIMNQYTPMPACAGDPLLCRPVTQKEYDEVVDFAILLGMENGFIQEGGTVSESFIPAWDGTGIFPNIPSHQDTSDS